MNQISKFSCWLIALCSCVAHGTANSSFKSDGLPRAVFDLNCPAEKISITVLKDTADGMIGGSRADLGGSSVGVQGCDQRATYVYNGEAWVLNSDTRSGSNSTTAMPTTTTR